jgi:hypothetical protein
MGLTWEAVSALSSIVGTILVLATAWIALHQFREAAGARQFQGIITTIDQLQSSSLRNVRWLLRRNRDEIDAILAGPDPLNALDEFLGRPEHPEGSPTSVADLRTSMAVLEFLGVLCLNNKVPESLERSYLAATIVSYWKSVEPIVLVIRQDSGDSGYLQHIECVVQLAISGALFKANAKAVKSRELRRIISMEHDAVLRRARRQDPLPLSEQ